MKYSISILLTACSTSPYSDYWDDPDLYPEVTEISPNSLEGTAGGQEIIITGKNLKDTRTVVIGSRNADIIETSETTVTIKAPYGHTGGNKELGLVTDDGMIRITDAINYNALGSEWWDSETSSVAIVRMDCPVEAYGSYEDDYYPLYWCGIELGYSWVNTMMGQLPQPGMSGEITDLNPISMSPLDGSYKTWGPSDISMAESSPRYGSYAIGDSLEITTDRNIERDLDFINERIDLFTEYYYWSEDITSTQPVIALYDENSCWLADVDVDAQDANTLILNEEFDSATGILIGYDAIELYEGEEYNMQGFTSSAFVETDGTQVKAKKSGAYLQYDDYSGQFVSKDINNSLGVGDFPFGTYQVHLDNFGTSTFLGEMESSPDFQLTYPDLLSGQEQLVKSEDYYIEWDGGTDEDPSIVVAELRIYDFDVDSPNGWFEIARLVRAEEQSAGEIVFSSEELQELPTAPNLIDEYDDMYGLWGELTVTRHQFRKVPHNDGNLVVDFVHSIQSVVDLIE